MKSSKGKEFVAPDVCWVISEHKALQKKDKGKKFWIKTFNRCLRRYFKKKIREYL